MIADTSVRTQKIHEENLCKVCGKDKTKTTPYWQEGFCCPGCGRYKTFCERLGEADTPGIDRLFDIALWSPVYMICGFLILCLIGLLMRFIGLLMGGG